MIDFRIVTFITLCKELNYTKTAKILSITQPTVTQHIQYLEHLYSVKLFTYENKKLTLTAEGEFLYQKSLTFISDSTKLFSQLKNFASPKTSIKIGATMTIGEFVFPPVLIDYCKTYPNIDISLTINNTQKLLELLQDGKIDCALIEGYFDKKNFNYKWIKDEDFICVSGKNFPAESSIRRIEDTLNFPLLIREEGSGTREVLERFLAEHSIRISNFPSKTILNNLNVIKKFCMENMGLTFLYRSVVNENLKANTLKEINIQNFHVQHEFNFVTLQNSIFQDDVIPLYNFIKQHFEKSH